MALPELSQLPERVDLPSCDVLEVHLTAARRRIAEALEYQGAPAAAWSFTMERVLWPLLEETTFGPSKALIQTIRSHVRRKHVTLNGARQWTASIVRLQH